MQDIGHFNLMSLRLETRADARRPAVGHAEFELEGVIMALSDPPRLARARQVANLRATLGPGPQQGRQASARGGLARPSSSAAAYRSTRRYSETRDTVTVSVTPAVTVQPPAPPGTELPQSDGPVAGPAGSSGP